MEPADREPGGHGHGHGHRIETSLLPLKKRASNYSSGDPYSSSSKKKKRAHDDIVVGAFETPVPRQRRSVPATAASREPSAAELAAPPAAGSPEPAANGKATMSESDEEKKWLSKGKWLAKDQSTSLVALTPQPPPPVKKLMHDGIRSFVPQQLRDEHRRLAAAATVPPLMPGGSPALERRLAELGATRPWRVYSKVLQKSDVDVNQNRLLVSCKRGSGTEDCPITRCFSGAELRRVNKKLVGLAVTALDRGGASYALTCKFLKSNSGYRFISEWKDFLMHNGLDLDAQTDKSWTRHVEVELWAFRSRRLPFQPLLDAEGRKVTETFRDEDGEKVSVDRLISHHLDPEGALGLLLLHHEIKTEEEEDDDWKQKQGSSLPRSVARKKGKKQSGKRGALASASASAVALPAPVAEQRGARWNEELLCAAIGLEKLRQSISKQWQEYVDRGGHGAKGSSNDVATSTADVTKSSPADVEGEKINKKQKSPGTLSTKECRASSQTVDSLGNVPFGSSSGHGAS